MIILSVNHNYSKEVFELIRTFYPNEKIERSKKNHSHLGDGFFVEHILNASKITTRIYGKNNRAIFQVEEEINLIDKNMEIYSREIWEKIIIRKNFYRALSAYTKKILPWGILTGIRPMKLVHDLMEKGLRLEEVAAILANEYLISPDKVDFIINIASRQISYIYPIDENKYSLYIGIPFCPSRCSYCSFPSYTVNNEYFKVKEYIDILVYEILETSKILKDKTLDTIYIGGGTPGILENEEMEKLLSSLYGSFNLNKIREFTVECGRPDTINEEKLKTLKKYGVNRISINPQTMNNNTLNKVGRNHDKNKTIFAYKLAKKIGFDIINMDIILGLPGEDLRDLENTLIEISKLNPENLTVHTLSLKKGSDLYKLKDLDILSYEDLSQKMLRLSRDYSFKMNLNPYYLYRQKQTLGNLENIGWSKEGKEGIYNILMMEEKQTIIGLGMGSVSKIFYPKENRLERIPNFKDLREYSSRIDELIKKKEDFLVKN